MPGIRGLYAHASDKMRDDLTAALQARWDDSLGERHPPSPLTPLPLLDELLATIRDAGREPPKPAIPQVITHEPTTPAITPRSR